MSDLRKKGDVPLTPRDRHTMNIGSGNYNRFAPLLSAPPGRPRINSKRKFADDSGNAATKTPRLDANVVFDQLKGSEEVVSEIGMTLSEAMKVGESCYSATDGGMGKAFFKLAKTVDLLIGNQEKILSAVVDAMGVLDRHSMPSYASAVKGQGKPNASSASATSPEDVHPSVLKVKKLKQAISKA